MTELKRLAFVETAAVGAVNYVAGTTAFTKVWQVLFFFFYSG